MTKPDQKPAVAAQKIDHRDPFAQGAVEAAPDVVTPTPADEQKALDAAALAQANRGLSSVGLLSVRVLAGLAILGIWQLIAVISPGVKGNISSPSEVGSQLKMWLSNGILLHDLGVTLRETAYGFLLGAAAGIIIGVAFGLLRTAGDIAMPYVSALNSLPKVALAPLFILWFGIEMKMKIVLSAVLVFFIVFLTTINGVRDRDVSLMESMRLLGAKRRQVLLKYTMPATAPAIMLGIRMSIPYALMGALVGELIASSDGLGFLILNSSSQFDTAGVFACLLVLAILAMLLNQIVELIDNWMFAWKRPSR